MERNNTLLTESKFAPGKGYSALSQVWEFTFVVLFLYIFFIQNTFWVVNGLIIALCGLSAVFMFVNLIFVKNGIIHINHMWGIICFVFVGLGLSFVFSYNLQDSIDVGFRMVEYLIIGCSLHMFITSYPQRLMSIIRSIWFSLTLLCIFVLVNGTEVTGAGAIGLETLNVNLLSSYITIQLFCSFMLLGNTSRRFSGSVYVASMLLALFVQILAASRRGFIVACAFLLLAVVFCVIPRYTQKYSKKRTLFIMFLIVLLFLSAVYIGQYVFNETLLGQRFLGYFNSGDEIRETYRNIAFREFYNNPIFGVGLNGLESIMGAYSHSLYYETLACTGLTGALILAITIFLIGLSLYNCIKDTAVRNKKDAYISKLCFLYLGVLLAAGIAVTTIYDFYFYICTAMLSAVISVNKKEDAVIEQENERG